MRETWFIKNVHTRELTISDLDKAPAIRPNETVDMLRYHTKQEIEQSESLAAAIAANWVTLIKRRDSATTVKITPDDINISIENAETAESVRYYGEMYADEATTTITVSSANVPNEITTGWSDGPRSGIAFENGYRLKIVMPGTYYVFWAIAAKTSAGAGQELMGAIFKNGARQPNGTNHTTTAASMKDVAFSGSTLFPSLVAGDLMSLSISNETLATDIIIEHLNFVMLRIGN